MPYEPETRIETLEARIAEERKWLGFHRSNIEHEERSARNRLETLHTLSKQLREERDQVELWEKKGDLLQPLVFKQEPLPSVDHLGHCDLSMVASRAKDKVKEKHPEAYASLLGGVYLIISPVKHTRTGFGTLGFGPTAGQAWINAADRLYVRTPQDKMTVITASVPDVNVRRQDDGTFEVYRVDEARQREIVMGRGASSQDAWADAYANLPRANL